MQSAAIKLAFIIKILDLLPKKKNWNNKKKSDNTNSKSKYGLSSLQ